MTNRKSINSFVFIVVLVVLMSVFMFSVLAEKKHDINDNDYDSAGVCGDNILWFYWNDDDYMIIAGSGDMDNYTSYSAPWYSLNPAYIFISKGVETIGNYAFYSNRQLIDVEFEKGSKLKKIGQHAFDYCNNLTKLVLPSSVETIGESAFNDMSSLRDFRLPPKVNYIESFTFDGCINMKTFYMSGNVVQLGPYAFYDCDALKTVYYGGSESTWNTFIAYYYYSSSNSALKSATKVYNYENHFIDIPYEANYLKAVNWAYNNEVIKGTTEDTFSPDDDCKRCDLAVMLYRMYGKPSISGMSIPFTDVKSSDYYYSAVVWAYNNGYIKGTSSTTFKPKGSISRQDMVVILWRINGSKKVDIENPFTDVDDSSYAYKAIMWAYQNKITSGTSATKFSPKANCLRYQLAIFLNKFNNIQHVIS